MPKMTIRVILKSDSEITIKCDKFTIKQNGFGQAAADIFEHYAKLKTDHATKNSVPERAV